MCLFRKINCLIFLLVRILVLVEYAFRTIELELVITYSDVLEYIKECLAVMSECNRTVMRIVAADKSVTIESAHFLDGKYACSTERSCGNRKNLTFGNISTKLVVGC